MLSAIMEVVTVAVALGQAVPDVVGVYTSLEACQIAAAKASAEHADKLKANGAALVCFKIVYPV